MSPLSKLSIATLCSVALQAFAVPAMADRAIIKNPGDHPQYRFELEPHLLLGLWGVPGPAGAIGYGAGFRGSIVVVDNGFVKEINNNVAITFGLDWLHYDVDNWCDRYWRNGNRVYCNWDNDADVLWLPVAMQWNFYLSENWSVFGEPGAALRINDNHYDDKVGLVPVFYGGGRFYFSNTASLTMRIGWPSGFGIGVSFFL
ncbi:MAG: hypothetical protein ACM3ZE_18110 [Myxococcales bacterium]